MWSIKASRQLLSKTITLEDLDLLLAHCLKKNQTYLHTYPEARLSFVQLIKLRHLVRQRQNGYSVAAIIGHKEFFGLNFLVSKHTLIPRPETELLVEEALKQMQQKTMLIDVGTGSGCIPISVIKNTKAAMISAYAIDIDSKALAIARKNADQHNTAIHFLQGNLLEPLQKIQLPEYSNLVLTANLPYLREDQFTSEPSIQREPHHALVAEKNGLALYEQLFEQITALKPTQRTTIFLEIDPSQSEAITQLSNKLLPSGVVTIKNDLAGRDRLVIIEINP